MATDKINITSELVLQFLTDNNLLVGFMMLDWFGCDVKELTASTAFCKHLKDTFRRQVTLDLLRNESGIADLAIRKIKEDKAMTETFSVWLHRKQEVLR